MFTKKKFYRLALWTSIATVLVLLFDVGFFQSNQIQEVLNDFYLFAILIGLVSTVLRYVDQAKSLKISVLLFDIGTFLYTFFALYLYLTNLNTDHSRLLFYNTYWIKLAVVFTFIRQFFEQNINFKRSVLNPAQLFIASFLVIILGGALLLKLPTATVHGISFLDALFTSVSAVCVTGLAVVDTGQVFTQSGQIFLICLIQVGGLGILTFVSYFSYFFKGGASYENQLTLGDIVSTKRLSEVFSILKQVLLITFGIEFIAGILIYFSLDSGLFESKLDQLFFAGFHAISAFCNAGFSTLSNSLYQEGFRFNYNLQFVVILTFFLGALGFPIIANVLEFLKHKIQVLLSNAKNARYRPWVITINSKITLVTTLSLTAFGFILFYLLEYNNTLAEHQGIGKMVTALFGAATPRTAGFNSIDSAAMLTPTVVLILFLMWIGASPGSTGGGIKTSTLAIVILNVYSQARGKERIEVFGREIADVSVKRALSVITLSIAVIGSGILCIALADKHLAFKDITFECISAYSTVGMSLGITAQLSAFSKIVIMAIMFIGRVSALTIIIAVFKKIRHEKFRYPIEEISIN